jgi:RNA-binding motif protein, X-linked 2
MNQIRAIQALNKKELEAGIYNPNASWHVDYRDTAWVAFGGLPFSLSEGDVITIFSQYGEPVHIKLARDKETGKSRGFGWLKYEDQRSTDLAVDNIGGAEIAGRLVRVDHARYKFRDDEDPEEGKCGWEDIQRKQRAAKGEDVDMKDDTADDDEEEATRPMIQEERELAKLIAEHDEDDPMKAFMIEEKKKDVEEALRRVAQKERKHRHKHHHRSHRSRQDESGDDEDRSRDRERRHRSHRDETPPSVGRRTDEASEARNRHTVQDRQRYDDKANESRRERDRKRERGSAEDRDGTRRSQRRSRSRSPRSDDRDRRRKGPKIDT